jgi:pentatricopeptide repeat protein
LAIDWIGIEMLGFRIKAIRNSQSIVVGTRWQSTGGKEKISSILNSVQVNRNDNVGQLRKALNDGDVLAASELFVKNQIKLNRLRTAGLDGRLFRAVMDADAAETKTAVSPKQLFKMFVTSGTPAPWICSTLVLQDVVNGHPEQGLQTWVEYLESLREVSLVNLPQNKEAAWAALIAYVDNCQGDINADIALKLVPIRDIPYARQMMEVPGIRSLPLEKREAIFEGIRQIRIATVDVSSVQFLNSVPVDRPLELEEMYKEALEIANLKGQPLSEETYARFMSCFAECTRVNDAFNVWNHMVAQGIKPSIQSWNSLLKAGALSRANREEVFSGVWSKMSSSGVNPDADSFSTLIDFYFRTGKSEKALKVFDEIQEGKHGVSVTLRMFNCVLDGLLKLGRAAEAEQMLTEGEEQGYSPNVLTYNAFIRSYIDAKQYDKASEVVVRMLKTGIKPDVATYTNVIDSVFKQAKSQGFSAEKPVEALIKEMNQQGIRTNAVTMTAILSGITKTSGDIDSARSLFDLIVKSRIRPNARTFATIMDCELRYGDYQRALRYFHMMPRYGVPQGTPAHNQLIHWTANKGRLDDCYALFEELVKNPRTNPNKFTYFFILNGCYSKGNVSMATDILDTLSKQQGYFDYGTELPRLIGKLKSAGAHVPESVTQALATSKDQNADQV